MDEVEMRLHYEMRLSTKGQSKALWQHFSAAIHQKYFCCVPGYTEMLANSNDLLHDASYVILD